MWRECDIICKKLDTKLDRFCVTNIVAKSALNTNIGLLYRLILGVILRWKFLRFQSVCKVIFITGVLSVGEIESVICTLIDVLNNKDMF